MRVAAEIVPLITNATTHHVANFENLFTTSAFSNFMNGHMAINVPNHNDIATLCVTVAVIASEWFPKAAE